MAVLAPGRPGCVAGLSLAPRCEPGGLVDQAVGAAAVASQAVAQALPAGAWIAQVLDDVGAQIVADRVGVPSRQWPATAACRRECAPRRARPTAWTTIAIDSLLARKGSDNRRGYRADRGWAARRYTDIRYWNELDSGGHFAAFEQPELFVNEVRSFFLDARVVCDEASAASLARRGVKGQVVQDGDVLDLGVPVGVYGREHAIIHPDLPNVPNVGYLVADRFFYAGDAFTVPDAPVEVLAVPAGGAWMKLSEAVDYLRRVQPRVAVPVHDYQDVFAGMAYYVFEECGPAATTVTVLETQQPTEV